ncbi:MULTISPECIES: N-acyl homoserine lactonase family protein [Nocardiaceae]|uniref:N-acyl homoserine lactonase family protein n=1 Tax=Nocardiaceae TaxID=85025 RepID=UPI00068B6F96|nr:MULTISPECIES: N-acyl homoserine lactonase family protein [Rhodococcus]
MSDYSIWSLEFARIDSYPDNLLVYGKAEGSRVLPFNFVVLKNQDRVIMMDAGFYANEYAQTMIERFDIKGLQTPDEVLGRIGISPADVDTIVLTHHHFDHATGLDLFPNAQVYVQGREIENFSAKMNTSERMQWLVNGLDPDTANIFDRIDRDGRLRVLDGGAEVAPGIEVRIAYDTHTAGSQYAVLTNSDGSKWLFPGDVVYVYDNLTGPENDGMLTPIGLGQGNQECCIRSTDEMLTIVGDEVDRIIPWHDVRVFDKFPTYVHQDSLRIAEIQLAAGESSKVSAGRADSVGASS